MPLRFNYRHTQGPGKVGQPYKLVTKGAAIQRIIFNDELDE